MASRRQKRFEKKDAVSGFKKKQGQAATFALQHMNAPYILSRRLRQHLPEHGRNSGVPPPAKASGTRTAYATRTLMLIPSLRSFRLVCKPEQAPLVELLLQAQGFSFEPEPFFSLARRLTDSPLPLGSSLAAAFGYIYIQDRSSMLPPLALAPEKGAAVLDMCASPGSKTGLLAQLVGPEGFILANEPSKNRLATLRRNLQTLNLFCCATISYPGEKIPLPSAPDGRTDDSDAAINGGAPGWDYIQLDPPCSGWGTVEKNPQVLRLWRGDKVKPLIGLQRKLLTEAARLLRPGGRLVYSTCTTNFEENESQLRFAREELGLSFLPLEPPPGFSFADPELPEFAGALRVNTGTDGQGFFVALLQKPGPDQDAARAAADRHDQSHESIPHAATASASAPDDHSFQENKRPKGMEQGFFVRPWDKDSRHVGEHHRHDRNKREDSSKRSVEFLDREGLAGPYLDTDLLPPGDIAVFNSVAHFLPEQSRLLPKQGFAWKGFPLGRFIQGQRLSPHLRGLMPTLEAVKQRGLPFLDLDDPAPALALLAGQSLPVDASGPEIGLYFRGLPLCRLTVKGKRAVLPPL